MSHQKDSELALYELYLSTAEKVSDRRADANSWMVAVNSAIVGLYGYLQSDKTVITAAEKPLWLWAIPLAGAIVSIGWFSLLSSFRKLNRAKFRVLILLEAEFAIAPFKREQELYTDDKRLSLSQTERAVPVAFLTLYTMIIAAHIFG